MFNKHITPCTVFITSLLVRDKPLEVPASVKRVYYIEYEMWNEITFQSLNFNSCTVEFGEWLSNFILHFTKRVIMYPHLD